MLALKIAAHSEPCPASGCWLWTKGLFSNGYAQIRTGKGNATTGHRASWQVFRGVIPSGKYVLHRCDVKCCVNPDHLFLGTPKDNMLDKVRKHRQVRGTSINTNKLSQEDVLAIRYAHSQGESKQSLRRRYNVTQYAIYAILKGITWKWL